MTVRSVEHEKAQTEAQESERRVQELTSALATLENTRAKREVERDRARERRAELAEATAVARATYERACAVEETRRAEHEDLTAESARMAKTVAHSEAALQTAAAEEETHQRDLTAAASVRTKAEETREKVRAQVLEASQTYAGAHERTATLREALGQSLEITDNLSEAHLDQLVRVFEVLTMRKAGSAPLLPHWLLLHRQQSTPRKTPIFLVLSLTLGRRQRRLRRYLERQKNQRKKLWIFQMYQMP